MRLLSALVLRVKAGDQLPDWDECTQKDTSRKSLDRSLEYNEKTFIKN